MKPLVNKKGLFNYEILESFEAGMKLAGTEVKSLRSSRVSFEGSYVGFRSGEAFLLNLTIPPYQPANRPSGYEQMRPRKLLLSRKEIAYLLGKAQEKGLTTLPLKVYTARGTLKLQIGVARRKKKFDKREALKKRATQRDIERELK